MQVSTHEHMDACKHVITAITNSLLLFVSIGMCDQVFYAVSRLLFLKSISHILAVGQEF